MNPEETNGEKFNLSTFLSARKICVETTHQIISLLRIGMNESDIKEIIKAEFQKVGVSKFWHPTKIRISSDTMKSFREISTPEIILKSGDLCFLDLGPIIQDHEADYGETFVIESTSSSRIIDVCQNIFKLTANVWREQGLSGVALYQYAQDLARQNGYELNPLMAGHRLGDFPHQVHSTQKLCDMNSTPSENLWVLEIHIIDKENRVGAFFEDVLV